MPTEAQISASRLNAQKSTGPVTPEGKARSALNALKSGIDAWSHIIPGEDLAELEALTEQYLLHFRPADPIQLSLVDTLVSTEWIQRRLRRIEAQLWNYQVECLDKNLTREEFLDASIQHNSPLGHSYQDALDPLTRIQRRIDATNRMFLRTLKALQDLQAAADSQPAVQAPEKDVFRSPVPHGNSITYAANWVRSTKPCIRRKCPGRASWGRVRDRTKNRRYGGKHASPCATKRRSTGGRACPTTRRWTWSAELVPFLRSDVSLVKNAAQRAYRDFAFPGHDRCINCRS